MALSPLDGLRSERGIVLELCRSLTAQDWRAPSGCAGWSVADLVSHLGALYWMVVDPSGLPDAGSLLTEEAQDFYVSSRRGMSPEQVVDDYELVSAKAIDVLAGFEGADFEVPLGDLGTYPASAVPSAFCFDHYTHIRADLFQPRGPLPEPPPPAEPATVLGVLDWVEVALPQQNSRTVGALDRPVTIEVTGEEARSIRLGPPGEAAAAVRGDPLATVLWVTQRATWDEAGAETSGDAGALSIMASLKVF